MPAGWTFRNGIKLNTRGREVEIRAQYTYLSSNGYTTYKLTWWADDTFSCNCPGWANTGNCKHRKSYIAARERGSTPIPSLEVLDAPSVNSVPRGRIAPPVKVMRRINLD